MKAIAVGSMRPKAAGSGKRNSVGVRSGSVRLGICRGNLLLFVNTPKYELEQKLNDQRASYK